MHFIPVEIIFWWETEEEQIWFGSSLAVGGVQVVWSSEMGHLAHEGFMGNN